MGKCKRLKFLIASKLLNCSVCKTFIVKCYHEDFVNDFFPLRLKIKHAVLKFHLYTLYNFFFGKLYRLISPVLLYFHCMEDSSLEILHLLLSSTKERKLYRFVLT